MMRITSVFRSLFSVVLPFLLLVMPLTNAAECTYGSVKAWFRTFSGEWVNATAHPFLHRGESFEIKVSIFTTTDLRVVYLKLHEFGTPVYEVISGPSMMEQVLENREPFEWNHSWTSNWTMQVQANTTWVNASSPLEVFVQFTKNHDDDATVTFDILNAYILDSLWEQYPFETNQNNSVQYRKPVQLTAPFLIDGMMIVVFTCLILKRFRPKQPWVS